MNPWKRKTNEPVAQAGPNPSYDIANGEYLYTTDLTTLIENPPVMVLNPMAFVIPVDQALPAERGPENVQQFQSGHTNIIPVNPAAEQGQGRAPGWRWAHMPHVQQFNPVIESNTLMQDGGGFHGFSERVQRSPIWPEGYLHYTQQPTLHQWPVGVATVNQPEIPSFTEWVPPVQ